MKFKYKDTWDPLVDSFRWEILITGSFALSLFINPKRSEPEFINVLWAFSIYLEAVSIIPQMFQFYITKEAENITVYYLFFLGSYRAWYIVNWIYRYHYENHLDWISILSGIVQTALYVCFLLLFRTPGRSLQIVGRQEFLEILLDYWNRMRSFFMGDRTWNHMSARVDEQCESIFVADDDAVPIENSAEHKSEEPVKDIKEDQQETIIEL